MKIISVKKAEKQAKAYAKANPPVVPLGWKEEYAALQKPEYPAFIALISPLTDTINAMAREEYTRNNQVYLTRLSELLAGIKAREKYIK
jgi:hypothetical protein